MLADITEALRRGDTAAALAAARQTLADEPANAAAHHLLGVCLQRQRDPAGARAAFEAAIANAPDVADYHFSLATARLAEGDTPGAIRGLHEALALDPNQLGAYVMLLHLALARGDKAEAERNLRLAQRVNAEHPQVKVAEGFVAQANGDADGAIKCFTAAATADPNLAAAQHALGMAYLGRQMWPFAEQALSNALAMDPSRTPATLRALAEARRRQGKADATVETLGELLALDPEDLVARGLRAEILGSTGQPESALADLLFLLDRRPAHPHSLRQALALLAQAGRGEEALARAEAAIAKAPAVDDVWLARLNLSGMLGEDAKLVLDRWQDANPDSAAGLDMLAGYHAARGEHALAQAYADRALAVNPALAGSTTIKLQAEMKDDPALALARVDRLMPLAGDANQQRNLLGWGGVALDALGRHDEAAARWREMIRRPAAQQLPPPAPLPADQAPPGEGDGVLLWSPPGVRAEFLLRSLKAQLGPRMRLDRIGNAHGGDGFGLVRFQPGRPEAGSAERWRQSLQAAGADPAKVVDWLPYLDGYTLKALQGAKVMALLTDPRDALLNWMVHGSLQNYLFSDNVLRSAEWLAASLEALADFRDQHMDRVTLVRLDRDAGKAEATIEHLLGLAQPLSALFGTGARFPAGHWKHYRNAFQAEFERLAAVAARLGYPAD